MYAGGYFVLLLFLSSGPGRRRSFRTDRAPELEKEHSALSHMSPFLIGALEKTFQPIPILFRLVRVRRSDCMPFEATLRRKLAQS